MTKAKDRPPYFAKGALISSNESAPYGLTAESWAYFGEITAVQFVLCPLGHGVDTHRFYEVGGMTFRGGRAGACLCAFKHLRERTCERECVWA